MNWAATRAMFWQDYEVPFAHTVAPFPVERQAAGAPTFEDKAERAPPDVPPFFPAFPDPHTYQQTAAFQGHETDPQKQRQVRPCVQSSASCKQYLTVLPTLLPHYGTHHTTTINKMQ